MTMFAIMREVDNDGEIESQVIGIAGSKLAAQVVIEEDVDEQRDYWDMNSDDIPEHDVSKDGMEETFVVGGMTYIYRITEHQVRK